MMDIIIADNSAADALLKGGASALYADEPQAIEFIEEILQQLRKGTQKSSSYDPHLPLPLIHKDMYLLPTILW